MMAWMVDGAAIVKKGAVSAVSESKRNHARASNQENVNMQTRSEKLLEAAGLLRQAINDRLEKLAVDSNGKVTCSFGVPDVRRAAETAVPEVFDTLNPPASPAEAICVWDAVVGMNDAAFKRWFKEQHPRWEFPESKAKGLALRLSC